MIVSHTFGGAIFLLHRFHDLEIVPEHSGWGYPHQVGLQLVVSPKLLLYFLLSPDPCFTHPQFIDVPTSGRRESSGV